jgi:hypothetical protein
LIDLFEETIKDYDIKVRKDIEVFLLKNVIQTIPYCDDAYLGEIIKKGINKEMPFKPTYDKDGKYKGDRGFKDCVLWYSIISYASKIPKGERYIFVLLTHDIGGFLSDKNLKEFEEKTQQKIRIIDYAMGKEELNNMFLEDFKNFPIDKIEINYRLKYNLPIIENVDIYSEGFVFNMNLETKTISGDLESYTPEVLKLIGEKLAVKIPEDIPSKFIEDVITSIYLSVRYYKWFYQILDIVLEYESGRLEKVNDKWFENREWISLEDERGDIEEFQNDVHGILIEAGYDSEGVDIDYEVMESTEDD